MRWNVWSSSGERSVQQQARERERTAMGLSEVQESSADPALRLNLVRKCLEVQMRRSGDQSVPASLSGSLG